MPELTREDIVRRRYPRRTKQVPVPEWNGSGDGYVYVRTLMADEEQRLANVQGDELATVVETCLLGVCTKDGERLFSDDDADALRSTPSAALARCAEEVIKLNNLDAEGAETQKKGSRRRRAASPSS